MDITRRIRKNKCLIMILIAALILPMAPSGSVEVSAAAASKASDYLDIGACGANLTYVLDVEGVLSITGGGNMTDFTDASSVPWFKCRSLIKTVVFSGNITSISTHAFEYCVNLSSISIPDSVTSLGVNSFYGCTDLKEVSIPKSVEGIGASAFAGCTGLTSVTIQDGVTSIGASAFAGCTNLTSLSIPDSVTSIGDEAFDNTGIDTSQIPFRRGSCGKDLTWALMGDHKLYIHGTGDMTDYSSGSAPWYSERGKLTEVILSDGVTSIGAYAFAQFTALSRIDLGGIAKISHHAFYCSGLTSFNISGSNKVSIGDYAFSGCTKLGEVQIPEGTTALGSYAFQKCTAIKDIVLPDSVITLSEGVFSGCTGLEKIHFSKNIKTIGDKAFSGCTKFTSMEIPDQVTGIGSGVLSGCTGLKSVILPFVGSGENAKSASQRNLFGYIFGTGDYANATAVKQYYSSSGCTTFYLPKALTEVTIRGGEISYGAFDNCSGLARITIPDTVTSIGGCAFRGCVGLDNIAIPAGVTEIGEYALSGCTGLGSISLPEGLRTMGSGVFAGCTSLAGMELPKAITRIEKETFRGCAGLQNITIPERISAIGDYAFSGCTGIKNMKLPANITEFGCGVFQDCTDLQEIRLPDTVTKIGDYSFENCGKLGAVSIPEAVTEIGKSAFHGCSMIKEMVLPQRITAIGENAFKDCSGITDIKVPDSVTSIGGGAFSGCSGLVHITLPFIGGSVDAEFASASTSLGYIFGTASYEGGTAVRQYYSDKASTVYYIPDALKSVKLTGGKILYGSFEGCSNLESIHFPASEKIADIGAKAFSGCTGLKDLTLPDGIETIGNYAFSDCTGLDTIPQEEGLETIGSYAFQNCSSVKSVSLPDTVTVIGAAAFSGCSGLERMELPFAGSSADQTTASKTSLFGYIFGSTRYADSTSIQQKYSASAAATCYIPDSLKEVTVSGGTILYGTFCGCSGLTSLTLPENLTEVGNYAFYNCTGLSSLTLPENLTEVGDYAFSNCTGLTSLTLPEDLTKIGNYTFSGCTALGNIIIPDGVTAIGNYAFQDCSGITKIIVPDSVTSIGTAAFSGCSSLQGMTLPFVGGSRDVASASSKSVFGYIFGTKKYTGSIAVKQSYSASGASTCYIPESLKNVVITGGNNLLYGAFSNCSGLDSITLPKDLTGIGQKAFYHCTGLTEITIPQNVSDIAASAFEGCTGMSYITFSGNAPVTIASTAFRGDALTVYYPVSDPTWADHIGNNYGGILTWQPHTHSYQPAVTAPTCTEQGYTTYHCEYCSSSYVNDFINALGHVPVIDKAVQETCTNGGLTEGSHCSVCGAVIVAQTEIPKIDHHFLVYVSNNDATYDTDGTMTATCSECGATETVTAPDSKLVDQNKPSIEISVGTSRWTELLNTITFGLFFKDTQTVEIRAEDNESLLDGSTVNRLDSVYYYFSDREIRSDQLESVSWSRYTGEFRLNPDKKYIIYAKAVDQSGNTSYASSSGIIVDDKPPVIDGVSEGAVYCEKAVFKVTDLSLQSVTDNGNAITSSDGIFVIAGDDKLHTVTAVDDCGNRADVTFLVNKHHMWTEPVFVWGDDYKNCTAEYACTNDSSHAKEIACKVTADSPDADCITAGKVIYTAAAVLDGVEKTDSKTVSGVILGHDYAAEFTWAEDDTSCIATLTCQRPGCSSDTTGHLLTGLECVVERRTTAATCVLEGKNSIVASILVEGVEYMEDSSTEIIPIDPDHHISLLTLGRKEATATEAGYTGDTWCRDCGKVVEYGSVIPATGKPEDPEKPTPTPTPTPTPEPGSTGELGNTGKPTPEPGDTETPAPTLEPGNSEKPTGANQGNNTSAPGNHSDVGSLGSVTDNLAVGATFVSGKLKYKITSAASGSLAVAVKAPTSRKIKTLTIPATVSVNGKNYKVTSIAANAFKNCSKLKKITIGKNVTAIGKNAFYKAKVLKKIVIKSVKIKSAGKNVWKGIHKKAVIQVPKKKLTAYKKLFKKKGQKKTVRIV